MTEAHEQRPGYLSGRKIDDAFKRRAVELSERADRTIRQVAGELGVSPDMLYRWRIELGVAARRLRVAVPAGPRSVPELERENRELRAQLAEMQERESILKKSLGILSPAPGSGMPKWKR
jgi:transposase-like protein